MTGKRITIYILAAFVAGYLLLVFIQYNSSDNIDNLISSNEKLLSEFKVRTELKELEKDVLLVERKIGRTVTTNDVSNFEGLELQIAEVENDLDKLQKITDDDSSVVYIQQLVSLVHEKMSFNNEVVGAFNTSGKNAAEDIIAEQRAKKLTDSIIVVIQKVIDIRQGILVNLTRSIDKSGSNAQRSGIILIILVLIGGAGLCWFIVRTINRQDQLIGRLNISEKQVRESARIKENFMANMSHEIRTPMNAILGFTNLLQRRSLDNKSKEYVQTIQKSGENLLTIINDILDLSKIEAGMMRIESAPFSMRGLIHSVETMFRGKAAEKQLQLLAYIDASLPDTLEGDATRLTQILVNLIGNSLKFTDKGKIIIRVSEEGRNADICMTGITVTDTGIGIATEKLVNIFERFQQAEDSVTRKYGGTGLGLSIVKDLVLLQQGNIHVESEVGAGTTFRIIIPYKISGVQFREEQPGENMANQPELKNIRILVAEDNEINQGLIRQLLEYQEMDFKIVNNGSQAVQALRDDKYDLVLMDIQMPEMDGYTATQEIRSKLKLGIPVIAMTAHAMAGEREKCLSYGMDEYISKPIREELLLKFISQFAKHKKIPSPILSNGYKYIDLQYMKEVSRGNTAYEKTVTEQFLEAVPDDLQAMQAAWSGKDIYHLRRVAHNMKTSVSVMGLNELLRPYLDSIEYNDLNEAGFRKNFDALTAICEVSLSEARLFYAAL